MINQFKFKFTCSMFQALQAHMLIPIREVPKGKEDGYAGSSKDDEPKATTTQQKQNK